MDMKDFIGLVIYLIGLAFLWGRHDQTTRQLKAENEERKTENEERKEETRILGEKVSKDIAEIKALFLTHDAEPKYVSYAAHDKMQTSCQHNLMLQINFIKEDVIKIKSCQDRIEKILLRKAGETGFWGDK